MQFLSLEWVVTMVATVSLYWLCPGRWRQWLLIVVTFAFLAVASPSSAAILAAFAVTVFLLTRGENIGAARVIGALVAVFGVLVYFKLRFFGAGGRAGDIISEVAIPLGLSYYSFRCAHFVIERYRGTIADVPLRDLLGYLFFLPTIVVGPINRFPEYWEETSKAAWSSRRLSAGLERILFGYVKIAFLANFLVTSRLNEVIATIPGDSALALYLRVVQDGLTLYLLFAGFSDIAIGFGLLLGIRVMENFDWPYFRRNISDFWRSWHISLSNWARDYVYFPVLGATRNPYLATLASFAFIGLWHEISPRYIVWGLYHGAGILVWRRFQSTKRRLRPGWADQPLARRAFALLSTLLTFHFVVFGLVIVNQPDFGAALGVYRKILFGWI